LEAFQPAKTVFILPLPALGKAQSVQYAVAQVGEDYCGASLSRIFPPHFWKMERSPYVTESAEQVVEMEDGTSCI
jgi:hypothetical protein